MKILILVFCFSLSLSMTKDDFKVAYDKAHVDYKQQRYGEAEQAYLSLKLEPYAKGTTYYNLGNVYYKQGDWVQARKYYEKAALYLGEGRDLKHNLELTKKHFIDKEADETEPLFLFFNLLRMNFTIEAIIIVFISSLTLFVLFTIASFWIGRGWMLKSRLFFMLFLVIGVSLHYPRFLQIIESNEALVLKPQVDVMSGPDVDLARLFTLHEGAKVMIRDRNDGWVRIDFGPDLSGWVKVSDLLKI
jgi:tetratricopeptide (TPR) repeat protein